MDPQKPNRNKALKLCYIKFGDVVDELTRCHNSSLITGGHDYYVYSTHTTLNHRATILYLSLNAFNNRASFPGREAISLKIPGRKNLLTKILAVFQSNWLLIRALIKFKPNHILMVNNYALLSCYFFSRLTGAGFTLTIHNDLKIGPKLLVSMQRIVIRMADTIICHGPYLHHQVTNWLKNDQKVIEYDESTKDIREYPKNNLHINRKIITYIGRMESGKGIFDLYEAFKHISSEKRAHLKLCFAGSGSILPKLQNLINIEGMADDVFFMGSITRGQVANLIRQSWVIVTPTKTSFPEGRCMAAVEALSLGTPLIAPEFGPFKFLIKNNINGLFFTPDSITDLRRQLEKIYSAELRKRLAQGAYIESNKRNRQILPYGSAVKQAIQFKQK